MKLYKKHGKKILVRTNRPYRFLHIQTSSQGRLRIGQESGFIEYVMTCSATEDFERLSTLLGNYGKVIYSKSKEDVAHQSKTSLDNLLPLGVFIFTGGVRFHFYPSNRIKNFDFLRGGGYRTIYRCGENFMIK